MQINQTYCIQIVLEEHTPELLYGISPHIQSYFASRKIQNFINKAVSHTLIWRRTWKEKIDYHYISEILLFLTADNYDEAQKLVDFLHVIIQEVNKQQHEFTDEPPF